MTQTVCRRGADGDDPARRRRRPRRRRSTEADGSGDGDNDSELIQTGACRWARCLPAPRTGSCTPKRSKCSAPACAPTAFQLSHRSDRTARATPRGSSSSPRSPAPTTSQRPCASPGSGPSSGHGSAFASAVASTRARYAVRLWTAGRARLPLRLPLLGRAERRRHAHRRPPARWLQPPRWSTPRADTDPDAPNHQASATARGGFDGGAMVLTTARSAPPAASPSHLCRRACAPRRRHHRHQRARLGNPRAVRQFTDHEDGGGFLVGTKGLWQGVDVTDQRAAAAGVDQQAAVRAVRRPRHRSAPRRRRRPRRAPPTPKTPTRSPPRRTTCRWPRSSSGRPSAGSSAPNGTAASSSSATASSPGTPRFAAPTGGPSSAASTPDLLRDDPDTGERAGGNVVPMAEGWARIWAVLRPARPARPGPRRRAVHARCPATSTPLLPQTRRIRQLALTAERGRRAHRGRRRSRRGTRRGPPRSAGCCTCPTPPRDLKRASSAVIARRRRGPQRPRTAADRIRQELLLPAARARPARRHPRHQPACGAHARPGARTEPQHRRRRPRPGRPAARVAVSRAGKTEVADQLLGRADHGIRLDLRLPGAAVPAPLPAGRPRRGRRRTRQPHRARRGAHVRAVGRLPPVDSAASSSSSPSCARDHGLPVTALTATANRTVHAGLREQRVRPARRPASRPAKPPRPHGEPLVTVRGEPDPARACRLPPHISAAGPALVAGLAEEVLDARRGPRDLLLPDGEGGRRAARAPARLPR